uniref:Taste receptor type 1 member 1-like n=1 Tax=Sparus aurata TaxID=8175 RepID=A0A671TJ24_SPAAU
MIVWRICKYILKYGFLFGLFLFYFFSSDHHTLEGDFLIGGLFGIHHVDGPDNHHRPEFTDCSSYQRFHVMRFAVEQINNSTSLLPNVSLGYEIFDHCSDTQSFPGILNLISVNGSIQPQREPNKNLSKVSKVIAVVGTYISTETRTVAPLFMRNLIPMVNFYGASSSVFSIKQNFPSFLRTVHPNKDIIEVIVGILQHFNWRWVSFLNIDDDYGNDGREVFIKKIKDTDICLAYTKSLSHDTDYSQIFKQIEAQKIHIIIVFAAEWTAGALIESAILLNITDKVLIASDGWSSNKELPRKRGIKNIGTVLGVSQPIVKLPGFSDFMYASKSQNDCENSEQQMFCNQVCNCSNVTAEDVIAADPSFSFPVYSAVYAIAHALHNVLRCGSNGCNGNITVHPHMVLAELKKSNFTLLNQSIEFDENGDPKYGSFSILFWNQTVDTEEVGLYYFNPSFHFFINNSKIQWHNKNKVPTSLCSQECPVGHRKKYNGIHKCCFDCEKCPKGTYVNSTANAYECFKCKETEWSEEANTSCNLRVVEYIPFTDSGALVIMVLACVLVGLTAAMSVLFAINYNTPVVRSAGGPMCFLILGCLSLCSISVFFQFHKPTTSFCVLRFLPFLLFYTVCLACFVVRSFQIVCIFKIAAKIQKLSSWWMKYQGQWLVITVAFGTQALLLLTSYIYDPPKPYNDTASYPEKIILSCNHNYKAFSGSLVLVLFLCSLCFIFSYMGKDLPKNYNEAKAITFCLLLLILTWIIFSTVNVLYSGKYNQTLNALAVLSSLYSFLLFYFLPKCYIIIFQSYKNTKQYFQSLIQDYTKTVSQ